ncbi:hypothetical protein P175DRAFT_0535416 [Aspergillus ochraceoroseus IBT 24754]|uniref:DUF1279 domain-containing protein n=1 Tax=Aspergillus ochraceoroseus IBT 24754 TaxID=1392256 RepID=A0A2T5LN17_9EURO|nr:uncharacterized protein P175DRAFT_0535416 [Aspergillus ochraceoroseus IBT 24754]PTU17673.1 hypothetical protein P175DRAFT_0535416 [Aspergillus ochraceoroseus IBT 24754]
MSLRNPLLTRRWASQPANLTFTPSQILRTKLTTTRPFSLQTATTKQLLSSSARNNTRPSSVSPWRIRISQSQSTTATFQRFFNSTRPKFSSSSSSTKQSAQSLSQRLKALSREYGWSALWIYLFLSALDFPFCFAAVRFLGAETVGHYEHVVVESVKSAVAKVWPGLVSPEEEEKAEGEGEVAKGGEEASLWTQLALAYAIHKSFIFVRVPLTAAITPKVVKILRQWGWDIAKGKPKGM